MPHNELFRYWTIARIRDACESYSEGIDTRPDLIRNRYLRVFSTLVYVGHLAYIPAFQQNELWDQRFPNTTLPGPWAPVPSYRSMFDAFKDHQWMFFPVILDRDSLDSSWLPPERILPIHIEEIIRPQLHSERAAITKVRFHPSCNSLVKSDGTAESNPPYILKTYHGQQHEQHYRHEAQAFARLLHNPTSTEHVVKCHATFKHGETYNLVLEWVPGGDLLQYFETQRPPQTSEEIIDFWESLVKFTVGLHRIHQVILPGDRSDQYQLVHQDIKPDNILLDSSAGPRTYQFSPIIADLEHSHIMHAREDTTVIPAIDRRGNQMYCAPESSHHSGFNRTGPNNITWQADIFSAGAVLSDAASWVAKGEDGRGEYLRRRLEELEKIEGFANSGYETAFHDGSERLPCVDAMHRDIRKSLPSHDKMTARVLDIIENHMLVLPNDRLRAKLLYNKFEKEAKDARTEALGEVPGLDDSKPTRSLDLSKLHDVLPDPETPPRSSRGDGIWSPPGSAPLSTSTDGYSDCTDTFSPVMSPLTPTQLAFLSASKVLSGLASPTTKGPNGESRRPQPTPYQPASAKHVPRVPEDVLRTLSEAGSRLSMQDAADWRKAMKLEGHVSSKVKRVVEGLIENLARRDLLFFIDDTESMNEHSLEIEVAFQTLAYLAKSIDPDDVELSFVSRPLDVIKSRKTTLLLEEVRRHLSKHLAVKGRIESSLSTLINEKIMKRLPVSIPLLGQVPAWYKPITIFVVTDGKWGDGVKVGNGLTAPISKLMQEMKKRGLNRTHVMFQFLRFGDDETGKQHLDHLDNFGKEEEWDIVDTRDINGDVYSMFLAALTQDNDDNNLSHRVSTTLI